MTPGMELLLVGLAFALLVAGVVGSLIPQMPGAPVSLAGVYLYWVATGMTEPGTLLLAVLTLVGVLTWVVDFVGGAVAARVGGASNVTAVLAGLVGLVLFFLTGPLGIILGVAATVFAVEFYRQEDARKGLKAALVTTAGMLASGVVQALLTGSILVTMLVVALV
ncbi:MULTISPECIES: DUF456 domain-containing protein [Haloarcula]|uniref:DUF456 domain-containing protein n=1 Tax=Haloarcula pellucida TaxID=1427151 RepID=A0A830GKP3_9EURY|nr:MULTISPECIES: DUF456 domain-containing protein [Halomicroarcula]MBX0347790.1 DUF456 domain-containing protein [Halomicroarcula pellucida]MDS0276276.1 DUF456 domain-containing protein [Halomicroarcula sp. S1AR25-4]GGN90306.1 hypothetical protein GCM10009030_12140 [Halomicroarcula pellucida]